MSRGWLPCDLQNKNEGKLKEQECLLITLQHFAGLLYMRMWWQAYSQVIIAGFRKRYQNEKAS